MSYDELNYFDETPLTRQDVQGEVLKTLQAVQQGAAIVALRTAEARARAERTHQGFLERYSSPEVCRKFIEEKPRIARMILDAENGQGTLEDLDEMYRIFAETTCAYETQQPSTRSSEENAASTTGLSLAQINALPPERRRSAIEALGNRVGSLSIDEADPNRMNY